MNLINFLSHAGYSRFKILNLTYKLLFALFFSVSFSSNIMAQNVKQLIKEDSLLGQQIQQLNILQLQNKMDTGELSSKQLTQFFIQQINKKNPHLNAIVKINPKAMAIAQERDKERLAGKIRGLLHGIPIVIKDNIETIEMPTTAGSLALKNNHTHRDATLIKNLKKAGAIILAKTNLSEWANFRSERSSSGWSAIGGQTRNPHDLSRSACGSSSGSGAAIAANLAVAAIGTETDGSITCPSSANGIVGIKPSVGLVSRTGIIPISHSQDTAGPMAKSVTDAAIVLAAMQGTDNQDIATQAAGLNFKDSYLSKQPLSLKGKKIGMLKSRVKPHEGVDKVYNKVIQHLKKQGAIIVEDLNIATYDKFRQDSYEVLLYEFKHDLNTYLSKLPNNLSSLTLQKIILFNKKNKAKEMPFFQQEIFEKAQARGSLTDKKYLQALSRIQKATKEDGLDKLFSEHNLDIIISPDRKSVV